MARRTLEDAIRAGQVIEQGKDWPDKFTKVEIIKEVHYDPALDAVYSLQYSYDGEVLAVGYGNGAIRLYNSKTGELVDELRQSRYGGMQIMCLRFHPKEHHILLATTSDGKILACNTKDKSVKEVASEKGNEINAFDFSADGFNFATGGKDLAVRIYDTKTYQVVREYEGYSIKQNPSEQSSVTVAMRIWALKYHPEYDTAFITGGWEQHLKIWDTRSSDGVKRTIHGPHICGDAIDLQYSKSKNYWEVLSGSWVAKDALQIWKYSEPEKGAKSVPFHYQGNDGAYLYCAKFCDNDVVLAGGSGTNSAQAINVETGEMIGEIKMHKAVQALDTVFGGRLFAVGGGENNLILASLK